MLVESFEVSPERRYKNSTGAPDSVAGSTGKHKVNSTRARDGFLFAGLMARSLCVEVRGCFDMT